MRARLTEMAKQAGDAATSVAAGAGMTAMGMVCWSSLTTAGSANSSRTPIGATYRAGETAQALMEEITTQNSISVDPPKAVLRRTPAGGRETRISASTAKNITIARIQLKR
jgi:hypothetical protein